MTIVAALHHLTRYSYDRPVTLGPQIIRLRPAPHTRTRIPSYSLKIKPTEHFINWQQDPFGNWLARLVFPKPATEFSVEVDLTAEMVVINPFDFFVEPYAEALPFAYTEDLARELAPYLEVDEHGPALAAFLDGLPAEAPNTVTFLVELNARLQREIKYLVRMDPGTQTPDETLTLRSGSCRDSAWLLVQILRSIGLAARFVSGYLIQLKHDIEALDGPTGAAHDFTDCTPGHEVYLPGAGWIGLDVTSGLMTGEGHIPLAATPHYRSAAPISGVVEPANVDFGFEMNVQRLREPVRITKPFEEDRWHALDRLGEAVDADLAAGDVRLTLGGEPTFCSIDDFESAEWNTSAMGPTKRGLADQLMRRLGETFGRGGLPHHGQGKWYPGELLPRWAFALYWRRDGEPIWRGEAEIAEEPEEGAALSHGLGSREAASFARRLAEFLDLDPACVSPAFEDPIHWIAREGELPPNVDLGSAAVDDPVERASLRRVMEAGLSRPTGYVLPLRRWRAGGAQGWASEAWSFRRGRLYLTPGDSPVGYRLPLASLPELKPEDYPHVVARDPTEPRGPLPTYDELRRGPEPPATPAQSRARKAARAGPVRTALTIEPRDGIIYIFMPPTETAEDYLEIVCEVEATAAELGVAIRLEGYGPPADPRLDVSRSPPIRASSRSISNRRTTGASRWRSRGRSMRKLGRCAWAPTSS